MTRPLALNERPEQLDARFVQATEDALQRAALKLPAMGFSRSNDGVWTNAAGTRAHIGEVMLAPIAVIHFEAPPPAQESAS